MSKLKNRQLPYSWDSRDKQQRLPLEDFLTLIRENLIAITTAQEILQAAYIHLKDQETVQRDQCNYIIGLAHSMDSSVQELSRFLDQRTRLPVAILPLRHQLTTKLLTLKELLWTVLALISSLRSVHTPDPKENAMTRYKMLQKLNALLQESDNMAQFSQIFSDQAHFQENRNRNTLDITPLARNKEHNKSDNCNIYDISLYRKER